ncbi:MAG: hypothetical protein OXE54_07885 [Gammaproteobacteria bacterium]|nr:hypothetical protein [Gammaproteobacteria bacterium]
MRFAPPPSEAARSGPFGTDRLLVFLPDRGTEMENQPATPEPRQRKVIQITIEGTHLVGFATLALAISGLLFAYIDAKFDAVDQRLDAVNQRIDYNTEELRLLRVNIEDINERLTAVEATIGLRAQSEMEDAQIAASATGN